MSNVRVVLDGSSAMWANVFRTSPEIRAALEEHSRAAAERNTAELNGKAHAPFKPADAFVSKVVVADKTMLGKVTSNSKGARIAGAAYGLPQWFN